MIFIDGLIKPDAPGSLRQPARTTLLPDNWATVPLSFGLIMCKLLPSLPHVYYPFTSRELLSLLTTIKRPGVGMESSLIYTGI